MCDTIFHTARLHRSRGQSIEEGGPSHFIVNNTNNTYKVFSHNPRGKHFHQGRVGSSELKTESQLAVSVPHRTEPKRSKTVILTTSYDTKWRRNVTIYKLDIAT